MEFEKVNPLLMVAIVGMILFEALLIIRGEGADYVLPVGGIICFLAGVKTPDFLKFGK